MTATTTTMEATVSALFPGAPLRQPDIRVTPSGDRLSLFATPKEYPLLTVDLETAVVDTAWRYRSDNATTFRRAHGRELTFDLPATADDDAFSDWLVSLAPLLAVILGGASDNGPDRRPDRTDQSLHAEALLAALCEDDAQSARDAAWQQVYQTADLLGPAVDAGPMERIMSAWRVLLSCPTVQNGDGTAGCWEAAEWIGTEYPETLTVETTDAEIVAMAAVEVEAARDNYVLLDLDAVIAYFTAQRNRLADAVESAE